ncbi:hypothetical protein F5B18DRAFT_671024 [Nemania serpens]|nr:hypothetical protein F5B18DRAFT_671024 [Nemania serpens]
MGRARRRNRRNRSNRGADNISFNDSSRNSLDRDDDFPMRGVVEHKTNPASPNQHRGQIDNNNTNDRTNVRDNRGDRLPKNRNPFEALINNRFRKLNLDQGVSQDGQRSISQQQRRKRNQQDQDNQNPHHRNGQKRLNTQYRRAQSQDIPNAPPTTSQDASNKQVPQSSSTPFLFPFPTPAPTPSPPPSSRFTSPARLARFCTECSAVRRANITFRDWCVSALARVVEVLDGWSDEVGVSRGSGDEMDWQPEPVVRVVIVTIPAPPALTGSTLASTTDIGTANGMGTGTGTGTETGTRWGPQGQQPDGGGCTDETRPSPRGLRPETLGPAFSTIGGTNSSVWGNACSVAGVSTPGNASVLGWGGVGQGQMDARGGSRLHDACGLDSARMLSPPNAPLFHMIS